MNSGSPGRAAVGLWQLGLDQTQTCGGGQGHSSDPCGALDSLPELVGAVTREHKDEAGRQASDHGDDPTDVGDEERQNQRDHEPHQSLQDAPPRLPTDAHLHVLALETQPQPFDDRPGGKWRRGDDTSAGPPTNPQVLD